MRSEAARKNLGLPKADWQRYHLQILFVDRSDTVRARVATGLFERVAEWNGYGRALYPSAAGVDAEGGAPDFGTTASLLAMAGMLGIRSKIFAAERERFVYEDFDRNDIIVAMDEGILEDVLKVAGGPSDQAWYAPRCTTLTAFSRYCGGAIMRGGGSGVLEPELRSIIAPVLGRALGANGIARPDLSHGPSEWNRMVEDIVVACAGLVQYLADAYPPDLPEYDPV
ncbi:hypothetical protein COCOBI_03-8170 [Coccomyxa sp. Obi]|nr:hypothetical protein COCOBI_03-8170 [Coccomyxa sp. Obi]